MRQSGSGAKSIYYGWWVLLAAGTTGFLGFGAMIPGFLVFAVPIGEELGIDPARFAFVVGAAWAVGNLAALGAGWLADQYGGRQLVLIGGLLSCAGYAAVAGVSSYWQLVLVYSGIAAIGRGIGIVPNLMTIANQWFVRRKALAMTLLNTTFAGGAALMVPLLAWCEGWLGWRVTILYTGALSGLLVVGAAAVIRSRPEDIGLLPDGGRHEAAGTGATRNRRLEPVYSDSDFTLREAVSTPAFWLMTTAVTLRIASADALVINQIPMLVWKGIPQDLAAFYLSSTTTVSGHHTDQDSDGVGGYMDPVPVAPHRRDVGGSGGDGSVYRGFRLRSGGDVRAFDCCHRRDSDAGVAGGGRVFRSAKLWVFGGNNDREFRARVAGGAGSGRMDIRADGDVHRRAAGGRSDAAGVGNMLRAGAEAGSWVNAWPHGMRSASKKCGGGRSAGSPRPKRRAGNRAEAARCLRDRGRFSGPGSACTRKPGTAIPLPLASQAGNSCSPAGQD